MTDDAHTSSILALLKAACWLTQDSPYLLNGFIFSDFFPSQQSKLYQFLFLFFRILKQKQKKFSPDNTATEVKVQTRYFSFPFSNVAVVLHAGSSRPLLIMWKSTKAACSPPSSHTCALQQAPHGPHR